MHLLNVSGYAIGTPLWLDGEPLFGGRELEIPPRTGRMLPVGLRLPDATVRWSTAEISGTGERSVSFAMASEDDTAVLETEREVRADGPCDVRRDGRLMTVTARRSGPVTLTFG